MTKRRRPIFLSFPGAGGGRSRHACLEEFGTVVYADFLGRPNLTTPEREEPFLRQVCEAAARALAEHGRTRPLFLTGHSFGGRAIAHLLANRALSKGLPAQFAGALLFGYPLVHPTQRREAVLQKIPRTAPLLFISGTRDSFMGDFGLLEKALSVPGLCRRPAGHELSKSKLLPLASVAKVLHGDHGLVCPKAEESQAVQTVRGAVAEFLKSIG